MEHRFERPLGRVVWFALLAVAVALIAAVSAWAGGGAPSAGATSQSSGSPWQTAPVQESQQERRPQRGDREDCPEKDGRGGGAGDGGAENQAAPSGSAPAPEV